MSYRKYYVTNGNLFLKVEYSGLYRERKISQVSTYSEATRFKQADAQRIFSELFKDNHDLWTFYTVPHGSEYIITTMTRFAADKSSPTKKFKSAKAFGDLQEARNFIKNHDDLFEKPYIVEDRLHTLQIYPATEEIGSRCKRMIIPKEIRAQVYERSGGFCALCGKPLTSGFTIDHIVPLARGGTNDISNFQAVHYQCNILKGRFTETEMLPVMGSVLSHQLSKTADENVENDIIRAIVRRKIETLKKGVTY